MKKGGRVFAQRGTRIDNPDFGKEGRIDGYFMAWREGTGGN